MEVITGKEDTLAVNDRTGVSFALVVPTLRPGPEWQAWLDAVDLQSAQPARRIMMDSGSDEQTKRIARGRGFEVVEVAPGTFDHGGTRLSALNRLSPEIEFAIFLTQDAILARADSVAQIIAAFGRAEVGAAWGRQLPHSDATAIAKHARLFNYPAHSRQTVFADRERLGIKAAFCSNSFAAYRLSALHAVGGFPLSTVMGEDMHAAARLLKAGWHVAYVAEACVYHSHNYAAAEEFARYFDTGAFHASNPWLMEEFGALSGEGMRFMLSELRYLGRQAPWLIPRALVNTAGKLLGYRLGRRYRTLSTAMRVRIGMNKTFWRRQ
jgi:rhamnosyltransferase